MQILNKHRPFKSTGDDFITSNPIFSYYFYKYYLEAASNIYKDLNDPSEKAQLQSELKDINKSLAGIRSNLQQQLNENVNISDMLQYTQLMFAKNDHLYREGSISKQIAENFILIYRLYEVVNKFGKLDQNQGKRKVYSKKKFIDIMKQLKNNPPKQVKPPPPIPQVIEEKIKQSSYKPLPKPSQLISFNKLQMQVQANKCLENAISELSFDRFKYAKENILRALELIDQIIE